MYSLITKIAHSTAIKDAFGVARGVFRVVSHTTNEQYRSHWKDSIHKQDITNKAEELTIRNPILIPIKENKIDRTNDTIQTISQIGQKTENKSATSDQQTDQKVVIEEKKP